MWNVELKMNPLTLSPRSAREQRDRVTVLVRDVDGSVLYSRETRAVGRSGDPAAFQREMSQDSSFVAPRPSDPAPPPSGQVVAVALAQRLVFLQPRLGTGGLGVGYGLHQQARHDHGRGVRVEHQAAADGRGEDGVGVL